MTIEASEIDQRDDPERLVFDRSIVDLETETPTARTAAVWSLAEIDDKRTVDKIVDPTFRVRRAALEALDRLGAPLGRMVSETLDGSAEVRSKTLGACVPS